MNPRTYLVGIALASAQIPQAVFEGMNNLIVLEWQYKNEV